MLALPGRWSICVVPWVHSLKKTRMRRVEGLAAQRCKIQKDGEKRPWGNECRWAVMAAPAEVAETAAHTERPQMRGTIN